MVMNTTRNKRLYLIIVVIVIAFLSSCSKKSIDMGFLKEPESIEIMGDKYKKEIDEVKEKLKSIDKNNNIKDEGKILLFNKLERLQELSTVKTSDKEFMDTLMNNIKKNRGSTDTKDINLNEEKYKIIFHFKENIDSIEKLKEGYMPGISIYNNGEVVIAKYDKNSKTNLIAVVVNFDEGVMKYIEEYYNINLEKSKDNN